MSCSMTKEVINELGNYCQTFGKDFAIIFDEWLDWMIAFFDRDNVLRHDGDFSKIFNEMKESNETYYKCFTSIAKETAKQIEDKGWFDAFGTIYEEKVKTGYKASSMGQFFTPAALCDGLARIAADKNRTFTYDPACGSGRLPLAMWGQLDKDKFHYFMLGDLDPLSCKMSAMNMMLHGMFGIVERRDALSMTFFGGYIINEMCYPYPCAIPSIRVADELECRKNLKAAKAYAPKDGDGQHEAVKIEPPVVEPKKPSEPAPQAQQPRQLSFFNLEDL